MAAYGAGAAGTRISGNQDLVSPKTRIRVSIVKPVMEGALMKWTNYLSGWQSRLFVVDGHSGQVSYFMNRKDRFAGQARGCIEAMDMRITNGQERTSFNIVTPDQTWHVKADSVKERDAWLQTLIQLKQTFSGDGPLPSGEKLSSVERKSRESLQGTTPATSIMGVGNGLKVGHKRGMSIDDQGNPLPALQSVKKLHRQTLDKLFTAEAYANVVEQQMELLIKRAEEGEPFNEEQGQVFRSNMNSVFRSIREAINTIQREVEPGQKGHQRQPSEGSLYSDARSAGVNDIRSPLSASGEPEVASDIPTTWMESLNAMSVGDEALFFDALDTADFDMGDEARKEESDMSSEEGEQQKSKAAVRRSHSERLLQGHHELMEDMDDEEDDEEGASEQRSVIMELLSQLRIGMDLSRVTLPIFILERRSLLEMYADFMAHPDFFSQIPMFQTPEARFMGAARWFLTMFHAGKKDIAKKPYNPILGEVLRCAYDLRDKDLGFITYIGEQVSHHPPITAFYFENQQQRMHLEAHIWTKSKFYGTSVGVMNVGSGRLWLDEFSEMYQFNFPAAYARSILTVPWIELGGQATIQCPQSNMKLELNFHTKPVFGGSKHKMTGSITRDGIELFEVNGNWNGKITLAPASKRPVDPAMMKPFSLDIGAPGRESDGDGTEYFHTKQLPVYRKLVRPLDEQEPHESRVVWDKVTRALRQRNIDVASECKFQLEQHQRELKAERIEKGIEWKQRHFYWDKIREIWRFAENTVPPPPESLLMVSE
eukprot:Clim_evm26s3 gene=Clim_evmTU26s3